MSNLIDKYISQNNIVEALEQCLRENQYYLGLLLARICKEKETSPQFMQLYKKLNDAVIGLEKDGTEINLPEDIFDENNPTLIEEITKVSEISSKIRVMMLCNWCDSETLCNTWNKMSKGNYTWNNIQLVWTEPADWYVVINCPPITVFPDTRKTILFHMEPHMDKDSNMWGGWGKPPVESFKFCGTHAREYNNNEWHLSKTYNELSTEKIEKSINILSTVLSDKYKDPGHVKRVDFVKFLEQKNMNVDVYGGNKFGWNNYKGSLPYHKKDDAMFGYKYVFNAENHEIRNYYTEKLVDGILAECLVFYWGCPNIRDFFDERAFVKLELVDLEKDFQTIKRAIDENWWEQRLPYILEAKKKILNNMQFFPRLERILSE